MYLPMEGIRHSVGPVARVTPGPMLRLTAGQDRVNGIGIVSVRAHARSWDKAHDPT